VSLRARISLLASAFVAVFIASAWIIATEVRQAQYETKELAALLDPVVQRAREATLAQSRASAHLTDYVLGTRSSALADVSRDLNTATQVFDALGSIDSSDVDIKTPLADAITAQGRWIQADLEPTVQAMGKDDQQQAARITTSQESARTYATMIAASSQLAATLDAERMRLANQQNDLIRLLTITLTSTGILGVLALIILAWGTRTWIMNPLLAFRTELQRTRSQPTSPITVRGPSEFRDVMHDAEAMRRALITQIDETAAAYSGLQQQAPLALSIATHLKRTQSITFPGLDVYGTVRSAEGVVTGDWWDVFACGKDRIGFVIGDVVGHGERAAVLAIQMQAVFRSSICAGHTLAEACHQAVNALTNPADVLTTLTGIVDIGNEVITIVNAGHPAAFHLTSNGIQHFPPSGPLISKLGGQWRESTFPWHVGDVIVAFTDGLTEARNVHGEELQVAGVESLLLGARETSSAKEITEQLLAAARRTAPEWGRDDVTCLVLRSVNDSGHMAR
jgi:hypothetical protein